MSYQEDINFQKTEPQVLENYQALLFENHALKDEIKNLRARLEETEELRRAISEGDLDALVIPGSKGKGDLVFTLDSADRAYRLLVETMNEGTATLAFDGTILYCNRRLAELLNMPSQAIVGTSIHQFIAPESEIAFKAFLKRRINAGEINLRTKDGRSLPVYLSISSTQGRASPNAWCLVVTDLTEQKKNEEIVAAERLARSIIEQAAETIVVCDISGRIIRFSNSISKLCRCNPVFQRFEDIINLKFSGGEDKGESILPVSSALRGSVILGMEAIFESENHQKSNLLVNTGPLKNDDGKIIGCTVTLTDVTKNKQEEHRILRYNRILEGINRIFGNVVQAKTEEELGEACLSVALEVTGSEFGFINEMGADGLLHDVAKSKLAWEQCLMYDKTGHLSLPSDYVVHGLYGSVIINEKSFFTNDPQLYPDSIGLPQGHPQVKSFLGVPLILDGKTIGSIAVANREGGYSYEQQEDLEAIVPAVTQALCRKKEERERAQIEDSLRSSLEEIQVQTEELEAQTEDLRKANESLYESERRFELLSESNALLLSSNEPENVIQTIAEKMMRHLNCDVFFNYIYDEVRGRLHLNSYSGINVETAKEIEWLNEGDEETIWSYVARYNCLTFAQNLQNKRDKRDDLIQLTFIQAYTTQQLRIGEKTIGTLSFGTKRRKSFTEDELCLMNSVANQISIAVERKRAEEELTAAHSKIQSIIDNTPDVIYAFDLEERFVLANTAVASLLNSTPDRMIGKRRHGFMPKMDADLHEANDRQVFEAGRVLEFEEYSHLGGRSITWLTKKFPLRNAQGRIYAVAGISADITERKQMEEQIRQRAEEMETVMEVAPVAIFIGHDPKCQNITGNLMANELYDAKLGDNLSANISHILRFFHKGIELTANELPMQKATFIDIDVRNEEIDVLLPSGEWRGLLGSASPLHDPEGNVRGSVGAFVDITERIKAEEKIQTLANVVESSNDAIITVSLDGIVTSWNKGAEHIYGYFAEEVLGKNISILEPDMLKRVVKQLADEIKKGKKVKRYETSQLRKDGRIINISVTLSPIIDQSGNLVAISCIAGDITEKKIAEKLLHEKEMAEVANSTKSEFLANMSHELRTPLNSIIGFSDMLHEQAYGDLNQKQLRAAGNISKSGKHLLSLINNILDISKIEAGKMELNYKNFELSSKLNMICNILSPIADCKNINIEINIDSKLTSICADEDKFIQMMYNLVDNAIKFSYEDSFVKVRARKKGELVEISVKDTGIGIKTEDQNKLFKSFSQIDSFSSRKHKGTGLGLHLVKQIVQLHGGYVWFRSNLGEGSTFAFVIPVNSENLPKTELDENFFA